jgi:ATP-dependent DNA helicase Rep
MLANKRKQYGEIIDTTDSRFLEELPEEDVEREGFGQMSAEANQRKGEDTLSSLMAMFDD